MKKEDWVTTGEAAKILGVCVATIRKWAIERKLKCYTLPGGGHRRFSKKDLEDIVKQIEEGYE